MRSVEFAIDGISPADFASWNEAKVPAYIIVEGETMRVRIELPPTCSLMERLKREFVTLVPKLSEQSQEILWFILTTKEGWATHQELIDDVWAGKYPSSSTVSKAVAVLNIALKSLNFGYAVKSRKGIYRLIPVAR